MCSQEPDTGRYSESDEST